MRGVIYFHGKCNCNNLVSDIRTDQRPIYNISEAIIQMPLGIIPWCVQFIEFTIALVRTVKIVRRKHDDKESTCAPSKEKKSKERVKDTKMRSLRKKYDHKLLQKAVDE